MEVTHTNPIMLGKFGTIKKTSFLFSLAFCYSLYDDVVRRRDKACYEDECCIAPVEMKDDDIPPEHKSKVSVPSETTNSNGNRTISRKTKVHAQENVSTTKPVIKKQNSIVSDDENVSIKELKPKKKSPSPSSVRLKLDIKYFYFLSFS
jgi:hypothetical protein